MSLSTSQLIEGHLYSGRGYGYRILCIVDHKDVWYRYCTPRKEGGLNFGEMEKCLKSTFTKWGDEDVLLKPLGEDGAESLDRRDLAMIMKVDNHHMAGNSRGHVGLSKRAQAIEDQCGIFAEEIRLESREEMHKMEEVIRGYADRCQCHKESFDPMNPGHEGRGPGTCAQCKAAAELLGR